MQQKCGSLSAILLLAKIRLSSRDSQKIFCKSSFGKVSRFEDVLLVVLEASDVQERKCGAKIYGCKASVHAGLMVHLLEECCRRLGAEMLKCWTEAE
jgi:hypothetical protein